ncbi:hypothetical protein IKG33_03360 [Candidatus Saccharibacteria bacterium]|nr:hypothetical protein [Candidatus Saccharibacteria bacterium]
MNEIIVSDTEQQNSNSAWGEEYLKSVPEFAGEKKLVNLEEIANLCSFENTMICGHGTATAGDGHEIVESIFDEGVMGFASDQATPDENTGAIGSTDLTDNTVTLWSSLTDSKLDFSKMKGQLDNWRHRDAKNIILMRFPADYYHVNTLVPDERTKAYFTIHKDQNGLLRNYVDRRFIIGNYSTDTGQVELNPHFEPDISGDFKKELDERLTKAQEQTENRYKAYEKNNYKYNQDDDGDNVLTINESENDADSTTSWDDNEDWE